MVGEHVSDFGEWFIREVREPALAVIAKRLRGSYKSDELHGQLQRFLQDKDVSEAMWAVARRAVDDCLFSMLAALHETADRGNASFQFRLSSSAELRSVDTEACPGLFAVTDEEFGWIPRFSTAPADWSEVDHWLQNLHRQAE